MKFFYKSVIALSLPFLFLNTNISADESTSLPEETGYSIEEIIVTARKREESTQDVPIAITAIDARTIERSFLTDLDDLQRFAPNVVLDRNNYTGGGINASIRGISFSDLEKSFEPAVGISLDGVFFGTTTGANIEMFDIESVEMLRGPQGTLFGRNTVGGVINITRSRPTGEFGGKVSVGLSNYDKTEFKAVLNFPIIKDVLALKLAAYKTEGDSWAKIGPGAGGDFYNDGDQVKGADITSMYGTFLFTPQNDYNFEALLTIETMDDQSEYPLPVNVTLPGSRTPHPGTLCDAFGANACYTTGYDVQKANDFTVQLSDHPFISTVEADSWSLNMSWDIGDFSFKSITAGWESDDWLYEENGGMVNLFGPGVYNFVPNRPQTYEQKSQEFQIRSNYDGPFNFVAGAYYFESEYALSPQKFFFFGGLVQQFSARQQAEAQAVFGEFTYEINDRVQLAVGGRYTEETKDFQSDVYDTSLAVPMPLSSKEFGKQADGSPLPLISSCPDPTSTIEGCRTGTATYDAFTPRVSLTFAATDNVNLYATWSEGFRSGGWNGRGLTPSTVGPYDPEEVTNIEVGLKSILMDGSLRLNMAIFDMEYSDKQEEILRDSPFSDTVETIVDNAASATMQGFEIDAQYLINSNWISTMTYGYLDAGYDSFLDQFGNDVKSTRNFRGAPEETWSVGTEFFFPAGLGEIAFNINYSYTAENYSSPYSYIGIDDLGDKFSKYAAWGMLDVSVTYEGELMAGGPEVEISAFVNDLGHQGARLGRAVDVGNWFFANTIANRTYGVRLTGKF